MKFFLVKDNVALASLGFKASEHRVLALSLQNILASATEGLMRLSVKSMSFFHDYNFDSVLTQSNIQ